MQKGLRLNLLWVSGISLFVLATRLLPHLPNFSPLLSICLFGGATFINKKVAVGLPILLVWLSDVALNNILYKEYFPGFTWFYEGFYWQYLGYLVLSLLAVPYFARRITIGKILLGSIGSALLFFLVSNFGVWYGTTMYSPGWKGLLDCYVMGLPFLKNSLLGTLLYAAVLFGAYYRAERRTAALKPYSKYQLSLSL